MQVKSFFTRFVSAVAILLVLVAFMPTQLTAQCYPDPCPCTMGVDLQISYSQTGCNGSKLNIVKVTVTPAIGYPFPDSIRISWSGSGFAGESHVVSGQNPTWTFYNVPYGAGVHASSSSDNNGCDGEVVCLPQFVALDASLSTTNPACGGLTGHVYAGAYGGSGNYSYFWSNGSTEPNQEVLPGTYSVTITDLDAPLCKVVGEVTVQPGVPGPMLGLVVEQSDCNEMGKISAIPAGGVAPYLFVWKKVGQQGNFDTHYGNSSTISDLFEGTYIVTVYDQNNCSATKTAEILDFPYIDTTIVGAPETICGDSARTYMNLDSSVVNNNNCSRTLYVHPVTVVAYTDVMLPGNPQYICGDTAAILQVFDTLYIDHNTCSRVIKVYELHIFKNDLNITSQTLDPLCFDEANGEIEVIVDGGTMPYSYNWSNGSTTWNPSGLTAGGYTVTVIDANGCSTNNSFVLIQPEEITVSVDTTSVTCKGNDGIINLTISGGTAPYAYKWNDGSTKEDRFGLLPGTYAVTITDKNGCSVEMSITLAAPNCPGLSCEVKVLRSPDNKPVRIITSSVGDPQNIHYELRSIAGGKVKEGGLNPGYDEIEIEQLAAGGYYIHIFADVVVDGDRVPRMLYDADKNYSWCVTVIK